jgi:hypothetical protein
MTVVLNEEFESVRGEWINYDAYDAGLRAILRDQKHVDIRNFQTDDITAPLNVLELSKYEVDDFAGLTVAQVQALTTAVKGGEHWTPSDPLTNHVLNSSFEVTMNRWSSRGESNDSLTNYVTNPSMETNANGWSQGGEFVLTRVATPGALNRRGSFVLQAQYDGAGTTDTNTATFTVTLPSAQTIVGSIDLWIPSTWDGTGSPQLGFEGFAGATNVVNGTANLALRDQWQRISCSASVVAGDLTGGMVFRFGTGWPTSGATGIMYVDGAMIVGGVNTNMVGSFNATDYFDGATIGCAWTGTAHASTSTRNNMSMSDSFARYGTRSCRISRDFDGGASADIYIRTASAYRFSVSPGQYVTARASFRAQTTGRTVSTSVFFYGIGGVVIGGGTPHGNGTATDNNSGWNSAACISVAAPAGTANCEVRASVVAVPEGEVHYIDGVIATIHNSLPATAATYFDGSFPGGVRIWTGTAYDSTSQEIYTTQVLSTYNNWRVLAVPIAGMAQTITSITDPIDLLTGFEDDDFISLTLPDYQETTITEASTFLDMTSNPSGDFAVGPTASVAFNATTVPLIQGNSEFRVLRSAFDQNGIDLSAITGVRIRFVSGASTVTIYLGALRLLSKDWKYGTLDQDTRFDRLVRPMSLNGDPTVAPQFTQPIVWRAADVSGELDPKPIDFNIAVGFNTGSRQGSNQISIYGRELTEDFMQQLDLNGLDQGMLTGRDQPDVGAAAYNERLQSDLAPFKQDQLGGLTQFDLERTPDYLSASWIEFVLNWTATSTQLSVVNTEGDGYNFNLGTPLAANTNYVLVFELEDTSARAAIYPLGDRGEIKFSAPVFDSTRIDDDFSYKRRKGRFGWYASLEDGDAFIESIRFRSASYAEYRSLPYESLTPVIGAELTAESSPPIDLFEYFVPTSSTVKVEFDQELSSSGQSWRVTDYGPYGFQGIQSNPFPITDFDQTEILLDVYYPSTVELEAAAEFYLKSQYDYLIPLPKPKVYPDQWQTVRLRTPSSHLAQTGDYRLVVIQNRPANLNWWVDNVRIFERTVSWHGRAYVDDPWAETEDDWTPFQNAFNRDYGGILFQGRERRLQVKGVGHKQDATIQKVQFKPKYAELGRFVWPEQALTGRVAPVASYSTSNIGRLYTFNGFGSSDVDGMVINWQWTVSDGSVYTGPVIQHTFGQAGTYAVTLMVTDHNGLVHTTSANHSVA